MNNQFVRPEYPLRTFDPYDLWASRIGVAVRRNFYKDTFLGKIEAVTLSLLDLILPTVGRCLFGAQPRYYPIISAQLLLEYTTRGLQTAEPLTSATDHLRNIAVDPRGTSGWAWGLGFPWMSKNGLYPPDVPFITHTPYVMEALLKLAKSPGLHGEAMAMFLGTWPFLESLKVMNEGKDFLALSYAPVDEPRIVVNANAYAAFAYAMHAAYGNENVCETAKEKARRLIRWVVRQQEEDGSWFYFADRERGNFIDGFHSCFVVKNLIKVKRLLPDIEGTVDEAIGKGFGFIRSRLYDPRAVLVRRFAVCSHRDPFHWDLYDQAEYLGLLVDLGA
jgi:hypothetical protein